ncbi:hypothetical protein [Ammoniphilus resinae]|uniref:Uncharacterized protein n=1 Tax=Ammoniphilus resinae TaxID=861532 RepID=A0ABS4GMM0_9BACL|nr:hypothetical protein [Ammoniphilus resinae]MBP1931494.1 hypothetical protein [Ammoniphilus resinae]
MRRYRLLGIAMMITILGVGTAGAQPSAPEKKVTSITPIDLSIDRELVKEKAVLIDGEIYVPVNPLFNQNKLAYYLDGTQNSLYLFFGGETNLNWYENMPDSMKLMSREEVASKLMDGIAYEANRYHSGMMKQDIVNIYSLLKGLLETNERMENAIYMKLNLNQEPNITMLKQNYYYRSEPIRILSSRMYALSRELGDQLGSRERRMMKEVVERIDDALGDKDDALEAMEDWIRSSDEDDLDDVRDNEMDAKENLYEAIELLTGEDLTKPGKVDENSLKHRVDKWIKKQSK